MIMKKILCLVLILCCASMIACGDTGGGSGEVQDNQVQEKQVIIYEVLSEAVTVGAGTEWELPGMLTLPQGYDGKMSAVVIVHGSGANDMDGVSRFYPDWPNRAYKDIAEGLSARGIAVLRYDKRIFALEHALKFVEKFGGGATVWEETIEDAILAAELLKADARIDADRVFILGHSLGGMLAPRIHAMGGNFAGIISFAGSPRHLHEIIADQQMLLYKETWEREDYAELEASLDVEETLAEQIADVINMPDDEAMAFDAGNGVSLYYYKDMLLHPAEDYVKNISVPFLILHAENDLQVFAVDFKAWRELLEGRDNVKFVLYEGLNHYFMPSKITRSADIFDEYQIPANVDGQVLADIAAWVHEH